MTLDCGEMREDSHLSVKIICVVTITFCCLYAGPSSYESAQFWLWLVLVIFVIMAFIAFTVSFFSIFVSHNLSLYQTDPGPFPDEQRSRPAYNSQPRTSLYDRSTYYYRLVLGIYYQARVFTVCVLQAPTRPPSTMMG